MNIYKFYAIVFFCLSITMAQEYNPCEDKRFLELKSKSLDDMSDREYQYFNEKNKECAAYSSKKSNSNKKNKAKNRKLEKEEIIDIRNTVMMHIEEDKNKKIPLFAFAGTALTSIALGPIIGGLGGIGVAYYLALEDGNKLTPERYNYISELDDAEKNLYVNLYKQEKGKMQSSSAIKAATGGCCSVWLLLSVAIASAVDEADSGL